jgi:hypothetical protein
MRRNLKLKELCLSEILQGSNEVVAGTPPNFGGATNSLKPSTKANWWLLQNWEEYLLHLHSAKEKHLPIPLMRSLKGISTGLKDDLNFLRNKKKVERFTRHELFLCALNRTHC